MTHMVYEDYRKAALKHLKTCEFMIESLGNLDDDDTLDNLSKEERKDYILRDIYYLCGYVIEGIVNYCIYKKIAIYRQNPNRDVKDLCNENITNSSIKLGFFKKFYNPRGIDIIHTHFISSHRYDKNIDILKRLLPLNRIPVISRRRDRNDKMSIMFYDWKVEMRYQTNDTTFANHTNLNYDEEDITDFFIFIKEEIYNNLPLL